MKYKITIRDGILASVFEGHEIDLDTIKSVSLLGKESCHVKIYMKNGEEIALQKDQVEFKHE